ncbi:hypothetical protein RX411_11810 [Faecalibacterium prausnitzii]|jgi:hypothetical protein|nr:hypothetical protein [Faecalibacterium prausnitzii]
MLQVAFRFCGALLPHSLNFPRADLYDTHVQACSFLFYPVFLLHSEVFSGESTEKRTGPPPGTPGKDSDKKGRFILSPVI